VEHLHNISEWKLRNGIQKMKEKLAYAGFFQNRNPISMHWWQKWKVKRIAHQYYELITYIMIETVCLDKRFRDGNWSIAEVLPQLIELGLQSELSKRIR
jgi:hypothetical protein